MSRIIRIIVADCTGGFTHADIGHAVVAVNVGQVGPAHGAVLVEQEARAIDAAVVVQFLGLLQVAHGFVDAVLLLIQQRGVQPGRRVLGIDGLGP